MLLQPGIPQHLHRHQLVDQRRSCGTGDSVLWFTDVPGGSSFKYHCFCNTSMLMLLEDFRYDIFELKGDIKVEAMLDSHCSSGNVLLKLYANFFDVEEVGLSSTKVLPNLYPEHKKKVQQHDFEARK
ncbi:hypothetical protein PVK06_010927 [Gossypium arboreum]|uniref:Uncharacterized protein n=1 Tax=Gossypium arboreum TaxID=29729 RepID=A0ABR0Q7E3_GOSAR|nr:hypothetical protein PVK06_010927 [Gossypium arboreum]